MLPVVSSQTGWFSIRFCRRCRYRCRSSPPLAKILEHRGHLYSITSSKCNTVSPSSSAIVFDTRHEDLAASSESQTTKVIAKRPPVDDLTSRPVLSSRYYSHRPVKLLLLMESNHSNASIKQIYKNDKFLTKFLCRKFSALAEQNDEQNPYTLAIEKLNRLQSNANYVKNAYHGDKPQSLEKTNHYLRALGITPNDLNSLKIIHIAGTKGKGSTCAFVESILRANGYRTGFYSSPHLVVVRERIRLNGKPISEEKFAHYFDQVYERVEKSYTEEFGMPGYFNFLTIMAFHVFLQEKVDVAIMEVGIGGALDCTNVITKPIVTGVTSLDYDHCKMLGNTLADIAAQKAGIFKPGVPALTVQQPEEALNVLKQVAKQVQAPFYIVPPWSLYPGSSRIELGIKGEAQKTNASLAVQICKLWLNKMTSNKIVCSYLTNEGCFLDAITLNSNNFTVGLCQTVWHGRCEIIAKGPVKYFLDGAHTADSVQNCCQWFTEQSFDSGRPESRRKSQEIPHSKWTNLFKHANNNHNHQTNGKINNNNNMDAFYLDENEKIVRVLVFNCTGERNPESLLVKLSKIDFNMAIFTTNRLVNEKHLDSDCSNFQITDSGEDAIRSKNMKIWTKQNPEMKTFQVDCISTAIKEIESISKHLPNFQIHVLVCGSVHLVGGFINVLHPKFVDSDF